MRMQCMKWLMQREVRAMSLCDGTKEEEKTTGMQG